MIRFRSPVLEENKVGDKGIYLTEGGSWDTFPAFAEDLISQLGGEITYRSEVVTGHWWEFNLKGHKLRLIYDEFPINGVWLEQQASGSNEFMVSLYDEFVTSKRGQ